MESYLTASVHLLFDKSALISGELLALNVFKPLR
jgi:hypothetical protein